MPLAPADLLAPKGLVESSLFPGEDSAAIEARLQAYIDEKSGKPVGAVRAWAYHRAFYTAYLRLTSLPATQSFEDQGSHSYLVTQIQNLRDESERQLVTYRRYLNATIAKDSGTVSVDSEFRP